MYQPEKNNLEIVACTCNISTQGLVMLKKNQIIELDENNNSNKKRYLSVDVFRGFIMFFIVGGDSFFYSIFNFFGGPFENYLCPQLHHVEWEGFHFIDLIFPAFIFIIGMSIVFSLSKILESHNKKYVYQKVIKRFILLYILGVIYYGGISGGVDGIRLMGVLQRLALVYLVTSILFIHFEYKGLIAVFSILLLSYWVLLSFIPVPDTGEVSFSMGKNWANWIDKNYLPLYKWNGDWDPEGLLSTFPAIGNCILGVFASLILLNKDVEKMKKFYYFTGCGIALVIVGYLWSIQFPIIKNIWTSSYVLVSGGYSFILFGIFYLIIEVWDAQKWALPFIWLGMNSIAIYMIWNVLNFNHLAHRIAGLKEYYTFNENFGFLCGASVALGLVLALVRFLYNRRIFIKI